MTTNIAHLKQRLDLLIAEARRDGEARASAWAGQIGRPGFAASAANLAHYLALRRHDLRPLQRSLMALGLSSLGRLESRVLPTLEAVAATLAALCDQTPGERPSTRQFFAGEHFLKERSLEIFGAPSTHRQTALLVMPERTACSE
jgi:pyruvate kinase